MKKGDRVALIDDEMSGVIVQLRGHLAIVRTDDDFEIELETSELVAIENLSEQALFGDKSVLNVLAEKETSKRINTIR